ncbi:MAG: tRNA (adenosine(37)-N6)-threonylcarbamoyltransferase complex ATPase subunit type 1 TsaE [Alphaproteobacteria bacterium]|nr:tRNA (adenosine(37)-N6)-threonylcarbamoyltransferase complex ATPase subunit type 1 TsaE [Alphaproteobacteria bacterium]
MSPHVSHTVVLPDLAATGRLAADLAALARPGEAVLLSGPLGVGKTAFARAFVRAWLGDPVADVPSPTFTLVQPYDGPRESVWHLDLYRLVDPEELLELGIEQALAEAVLLVEWPDRLGPWVPADRLDLVLAVWQTGTEEARTARLEGRGAWAERLRNWIQEKGTAHGGC